MAGRLYELLRKIEQNSKTIELSKNETILPKASAEITTEPEIQPKPEPKPIEKKRQPTLKKIWDKNGVLVTHPKLYEVCARHQAEDVERYFARQEDVPKEGLKITTIDDNGNTNVVYW